MVTTWYYYDNDGCKQGPITGGQLKGLAKAGLITQETMLETEDGKTAPARKIKGLTFVDAVQSDNGMKNAAENISGENFDRLIQEDITQSQKQGKTHTPQKEHVNRTRNREKIRMKPRLCLAFFDFAFRDLRLSEVNLWICRLLYAFFWIGAGLFVILTAISMFAAASGGDGVLPRSVPGMLAFCLFGLPPLLIITRLILELEIMVVDWLSESTKAARKYNDE